MADTEEDVKKRRITSKDFERIEEFVKDEFDSRQRSYFRKEAERKWREVDRQIDMKPMERVQADGRAMQPDWHNVIELGELAKASEIITADVMRITFANENFFEPHVQLEGSLGDGGSYIVPDEVQEKADGLLRALMIQQQKDFGFKARFKLSVKEALHHGSFVAEVRWESMLMNDGANVMTLEAPVWQPYSMWNSYPDPSPSVIGTNLFYSGSMMLVEYIPLWRLKRLKGSGWMQARIAKVKKQTHKDKDNETEDVKLVKYIGDISIDRQDGDIFLPNMRIVLANDTLVYAEPNELPVPSIVYAGYERQDIRDPYYTSPIIKQSPIHKFTTVMANKFADAVDLRTEPPIEYDANDPDYVLNGGPQLIPGAKNPTKSMGKGFKTLELGDPQASLEAMQFGIRQMQEGLGVSSLRQGVNTSDRQTATEAKIMEAGSEVRTTDFIASLGETALRPFLYLQHAWNRKKFKRYEAYSNEMGTPDSIVYTKKDVDVSAHFDVVGAKSILGEQQKQQQLTNLTLALSQNPLFAPLLKADRIALDLYKDAGKKNPEEWIKTEQDGPQVPPQVQALIQELQARLQQAESGMQAKIAKIEADKQKTAAQIQLEREKAVADYKLEVEKARNENALKWAELRAEMALEVAKAKSDSQNNRATVAIDMNKAASEFGAQLEQMSMGHSTEIAKAAEKLVNAASKITDAAEKMASRPRGKAKIKRTADGYEVEH